jgi:hypothetical protein
MELFKFKSANDSCYGYVYEYMYGYEYEKVDKQVYSYFDGWQENQEAIIQNIVDSIIASGNLGQEFNSENCENEIYSIMHNLHIELYPHQGVDFSGSWKPTEQEALKETLKGLRAKVDSYHADGADWSSIGIAVYHDPNDSINSFYCDMVLCQSNYEDSYIERPRANLEKLNYFDFPFSTSAKLDWSIFPKFWKSEFNTTWKSNTPI